MEQGGNNVNSNGGEELDVVLQALAHPVRRRVVELLAERENGLSYSDLMKLTGVDDSGTFGFHMRRLRGLVEKDENGVYRLTELGRQAYRVLRLLRAEEGLGERENAAKEPHGSENVVSIEGVPSLELGEDFLRELAEKGQSLVVRYVTRLVVKPLSRELFEKVVKRIEYVESVYAPENLRGFIEPRLRYVARIHYYSGSPPSADGIDRFTSSIVSAVGGLVSSIVSKALSAAGIGDAFSLQNKGLRKGRLSDSLTPKSDKLALLSDTCTIKLQGLESDKISYDYSFIAVDPGLSVNNTDNAVEIECEPLNARKAKLDIKAPKDWPRELVVKLDTSTLETTSISVNRASFTLDTSDVHIELLLYGENPLVELRTDTSEIRGMIKGNWRGEAVIKISADTSDIDLSIETSDHVAVAVEPEYIDTTSIKIKLDDKAVGIHYRSEDYEKAAKKLRIILFSDTSDIHVDMRTRA